MTPGGYFAGDAEGLRMYRRIAAVVADIGSASVRVSKSEIAFRRRRGFAYVWRPDLYLKPAGVPAVLSIALPRHARSPRFKSVIHPSPRAWMHHIELRSEAEVDGHVRRWLAEAFAAAA